MHKRIVASALAASAAALLAGTLSVTPALAKGGGGGGGGGRPCGPASSTSGTGTTGTPWTLKSMYDDDGPGGIVVVGEEFQIETNVAGQVWAVTLADNGTAFFTGNVTSAGTTITVMQKDPYPGGTSHVSANAVNQQTGEVINGAVDLLAAPPACGEH